jgi:hypothetical protein
MSCLDTVRNNIRSAIADELTPSPACDCQRATSPKAAGLDMHDGPWPLQRCRDEIAVRRPATMAGTDTVVICSALLDHCTLVDDPARGWNEERVLCWIPESMTLAAIVIISLLVAVMMGSGVILGAVVESLVNELGLDAVAEDPPRDRSTWLRG